MWEKDQRSSGEYSKVVHYLLAFPSVLAIKLNVLFIDGTSGDIDKRYEM